MISADVDAAYRTLVGALAGPDPVPAGGAAAVAAIAMGVGLGMKVIHLSCSGPSDLDSTRDGLGEVLARLLPEFSEDCLAFSRLLEALRRPRDDTGRAAEVRTAWREATEVPVSVATIAREAEILLARCVDGVKPSVGGDLEAAFELVRAGRRIAENNARENAQRLEPELARQVLAPLEGERRH